VRMDGAEVLVAGPRPDRMDRASSWQGCHHGLEVGRRCRKERQAQESGTLSKLRDDVDDTDFPRVDRPYESDRSQAAAAAVGIVEDNRLVPEARRGPSSAEVRPPGELRQWTRRPAAGKTSRGGQSAALARPLDVAIGHAAYAKAGANGGRDRKGQRGSALRGLQRQRSGRL